MHSRHVLLLPLIPYIGMELMMTRTPALILDHDAALGTESQARMEEQENGKNWDPRVPWSCHISLDCLSLDF